MPLKRVIGLKEALAINIGAIIGAGIFAISGLAAGIAGPATIIAIAIGAVVSILTGLSFAQLSHTYTKEGGNYEYARRELGPYLGFVVGLMFVASGVVGGAVMAISFGGYFTSLFGSALDAPIVAAALVAVLGLVNYVGVKASADASLVLTIVKVCILAVFIAVGALFIKPGDYVPFMPNGFGSVFVAAAFIFFAYTGFARVTTMGDEVKDPKRTIPRSIIYSLIISAVMYVLVMAVLVGIAPVSGLAGSTSPLTYAIDFATGNPMIGYVISIGALFATVNVTLSMILGISRVAFAMSRDGNLPGPIRRLSRFGTPDVAILVLTAAMALSALLIDFTDIASLSNAAALLSYSVANAAAIRLTLRKGSGLLFRSRYFVAVPALGVGSALMLIFFLTPITLYAVAAMLVATTVYYAALRRRGRGRAPRRG